MSDPATPDGRLDRRAFVRLGGLVLAQPLLAGYGGSPAGETDARGDAASATAGSDADDALDAALQRMQGQEPKSAQGLSTHAPMACEALVALGFADRVAAWLDAFPGPVLELPVPAARIDRQQWRAALGPRSRGGTWEAQNASWGDWRELFTEELAQARWQEVLDAWVARLAPGLVGGATHGLIRTAHAARALSWRDNALRRGELARGLAYWASAYEELPARTGREPGPALGSYAEAIDRVPRYWDQHGAAPTGRNIVESLRCLGDVAGFDTVRGMVDPPADMSAALSALTATFARVYLRQGTRRNTIAFVHAVTAPCALRRLAPHLQPQTARTALSYGWQAAAAIHAAFAQPGDDGRAPDPKLGRDELAARALDNGDEHAIKFTEVLLAEHALVPDPVYLAAAEDAVARL